MPKRLSWNDDGGLGGFTSPNDVMFKVAKTGMNLAMKEGIKYMQSTNMPTGAPTAMPTAEPTVNFTQSSKPVDLIKHGISAGGISGRNLKPCRMQLKLNSGYVKNAFTEYKRMFERDMKFSHQFALQKSSDLGKRGFFFMNFRHNYFTQTTNSGAGSITSANYPDSIFPIGGTPTAYGKAAFFLDPAPRAQTYTGTGGVQSTVTAAMQAVKDGQTVLARMNKCFLAESSYRITPSFVKYNYADGPKAYGDANGLAEIANTTWNSYIENACSQWRGGANNRGSVEYQNGNADDPAQSWANQNEPYHFRNRGGKVSLNVNNQGETPCVIDVVVFKAKDGYHPLRETTQLNNTPIQPNDDISKDIYDHQISAMESWKSQNALPKSNFTIDPGTQTINQPDITMDGMGGYDFAIDAGLNDPRMKFLPKLGGFEKANMPSTDASGKRSTIYGGKIHKEIGRMSFSLAMGDRRKVDIPLRTYDEHAGSKKVPEFYNQQDPATNARFASTLVVQLQDGLWIGETVCIAFAVRGVEVPVAPASSTDTFAPCGMQASAANIVITGEYEENVTTMYRVEAVDAPYYQQNLGRAEATGSTTLQQQTLIPYSQVVRNPDSSNIVVSKPVVGLDN
jgi:hypothetical protein